jgi:hypothetical protein
MRRSPKPEAKKKDVVWFAIDDDRPLTCFAGIWTELKGDRGTKSKRIRSMGSHDVVECRRRTDLSKSHAGYPAHRRGTRHLDARAVG